MMVEECVTDGVQPERKCAEDFSNENGSLSKDESDKLTKKCAEVY